MVSVGFRSLLPYIETFINYVKTHLLYIFRVDKAAVYDDDADLPPVKGFPVIAWTGVWETTYLQPDINLFLVTNSNFESKK